MAQGANRDQPNHKLIGIMLYATITSRMMARADAEKQPSKPVGVGSLLMKRICRNRQ